ncbi:hypothetical protein DFJ73DRAFT_798509 [Zopfochytrium polystomum]|nr:hypothetical protein DFJ73DRAFT_798509 [Zopfochytrium polystomum]
MSAPLVGDAAAAVQRPLSYVSPTPPQRPAQLDGYYLAGSSTPFAAERPPSAFRYSVNGPISADQPEFRKQPPVAGTGESPLPPKRDQSLAAAAGASFSLSGASDSGATVTPHAPLISAFSGLPLHTWMSSPVPVESNLHLQYSSWNGSRSIHSDVSFGSSSTAARSSSESHSDPSSSPPPNGVRSSGSSDSLLEKSEFEGTGEQSRSQLRKLFRPPIVMARSVTPTDLKPMENISPDAAGPVNHSPIQPKFLGRPVSPVVPSTKQIFFDEPPMEAIVPDATDVPLPPMREFSLHQSETLSGPSPLRLRSSSLALGTITMPSPLRSARPSIISSRSTVSDSSNFLSSVLDLLSTIEDNVFEFGFRLAGIESVLNEVREIQAGGLPPELEIADTGRRFSVAHSTVSSMQFRGRTILRSPTVTTMGSVSDIEVDLAGMVSDKVARLEVQVSKVLEKLARVESEIADARRDTLAPIGGDSESVDQAAAAGKRLDATQSSVDAISDSVRKVDEMVKEFQRLASGMLPPAPSAASVDLWTEDSLRSSSIRSQRHLPYAAPSSIQSLARSSSHSSASRSSTATSRSVFSTARSAEMRRLQHSIAQAGFRPEQQQTTGPGSRGRTGSTAMPRQTLLRRGSYGIDAAPSLASSSSPKPPPPDLYPQIAHVTAMMGQPAAVVPLPSTNAQQQQQQQQHAQHPTPPPAPSRPRFFGAAAGLFSGVPRRAAPPPPRSPGADATTTTTAGGVLDEGATLDADGYAVPRHLSTLRLRRAHSFDASLPRTPSPPPDDVADLDEAIGSLKDLLQQTFEAPQPQPPQPAVGILSAAAGGVAAA